MDILKDMVQQVENTLVSKWAEYVDLQDEFNGFRGRELNEAERARLDELFVQIQYKFNEIYPVFYFVGHRIEFTNNAVTSYNSFIKELESVGAAIANEQEPKIIISE